MGKTEFIELMAEEHGITKVEAKRVCELFIETVPMAIEKEGKLTLQNFGTFEVIDTKERTGYDVHKGEKVVHPAGKRLKFKLSNKLKELFKA